MNSTNTAVAAVAMAALLVVAGCSAPVSNDTGTPGGSTGSDTPSDGTGVGSDTDTNTDVGTGTIQFYVSDEENAIDDFAHLNVTITKVGLHRTGNGDGGAPDAAGPTGANESNANATRTADATEAGLAADETATATETDVSATEAPEAAPAPGTTTAAENGEDREGGTSEWVEYETTETVDLTELKGANATQLDVFTAPEGTYDKVFIYVDGINATLNTGASVTVKLPSNKLQINTAFTVGNGENLSFVYDLSVHKAGKSGKYILRPVVSQSGTGDAVEIRTIDRETGTKGDTGKTKGNNGTRGEKPKDNGKRGRSGGNATETAGDLTAAPESATFGEKTTLR